MNLAISILILLVNSSAAFILDKYIGLFDSSPFYYIEDVTILYYVTAFTAEIITIVLLNKFTVNSMVTGLLIGITAGLLFSHILNFFLLLAGGIDTVFVQIAYPAIINVLHVLYAFPIILAILRVFDDD